MECSVYGVDLNRIGAVSTWVSMLWQEEYNTMGMFQLEMQQRDGLLELFQPGRYCGIPESDTLMVLNSVQARRGSIVVSGCPATQILAERISTETISEENAEEALRRLVANMEPWPCVSLGRAAGLPDIFPAQKSDASILGYCEKVTQQGEIGFRLRHDKKAKLLLFECYKPPENPNARYSPDYGNVGDVDYSISHSALKNVAVVAGAGEGDARVIVYAGRTDLTGADRREMYVDARNIQPEDGETDMDYRARLVRYGEEKLIGQTEILNLKFSIDDDRAKLGDIIFCRFPALGLQAKVRIIGITRKSQKNTTKLTATVGTPIIIRRF